MLYYRTHLQYVIFGVNKCLSVNIIMSMNVFLFDKLDIWYKIVMSWARQDYKECGKTVPNLLLKYFFHFFSLFNWYFEIVTVIDTNMYYNIFFGTYLAKH